MQERKLEKENVTETGSFCPTHSKPKRWDAEVYSKESLIDKATELGDGRTHLKSTSLKVWDEE